MKQLTTIALMALLAACNTEREAAIAVTVTFEQGVVSSHVVVAVTGDQAEKKTRCIPVAMQKVIDVGVAQGKLPDTVLISAQGFTDADCQHATEPAENAVAIERRFRKGLILEAPLVLRQTRPTLETACANGLDDDNDGKTDCADVDCTDRACSSGNACVAGQTCQGGTCQGGAQVTCTTAPSECFMAPGLCVVDAGCRYFSTPGVTCDDHNDCTMTDRCDTAGDCTGQLRACTQPPPGQCWAAAGACVADAGCVYQAALGATCDDHENCTRDDRCDGDAGCTGTRVTCAPRQCAAPSGACDADGGCLYAPFDAGIACGDGGACNTQGSCLPPFPFVPSNVAINDIPTPSSGKVTFDCGTTVIDTGATGEPSVTNYCTGQPRFGSASITQPGGLAAVVLAFDDLEIAGGSTLSLVGARPAIIVSMKNVRVLGTITVAAGAQACVGTGAGGPGGQGLLAHSGAGGGGFATAGGAGGAIPVVVPGGAGGAVNGGAPVRGGCPGGTAGGNSRASQGGGGLQVVALGTITLAGVIDAPGAGGAGGGLANGGNGGGSGGALLFEAQQVIASSGSLTCNGGGGGEGGTNNAGQPGQLTATPAAGGTDLIPGSNGGAGAAGALAAQGGQDGFNGGGGGGGAGFIRFNVTNFCDLGPQVVISPAASSNRPDAGCP